MIRIMDFILSFKVEFHAPIVLALDTGELLVQSN